MHELARLAPALAEYVPAEQGVHVVAPAVSAYVPALQVRHTLDTVACAVTE
jgi:hypothetical protein